jgi:hypothetical protein
MITIIIPACEKDDFVDKAVASIKRNQAYTNNIIVKDEPKYTTKDMSDFYRKVQDTIDEINSDYYLVTNSDMLFGYRFDEALLTAQLLHKSDITCSVNACCLHSAGWDMSLNPTVEKNGVYNCVYDRDISSSFVEWFDTLSKKKYEQYYGTYILGKHFVPFMLTRQTFYDILGTDKYVDIHDVEFFRRVDKMNLKTIIALDSWCFHFLRRSQL